MYSSKRHHRALFAERSPILFPGNGTLVEVIVHLEEPIFSILESTIFFNYFISAIFMVKIWAKT